MAKADFVDGVRFYDGRYPYMGCGVRLNRHG